MGTDPPIARIGLSQNNESLPPFAIFSIRVYAIVRRRLVWGISRDRPVAPGRVAVPSLWRQAVEQCWARASR
jgi:hypothetical protein